MIALNTCSVFYKLMNEYHSLEDSMAKKRREEEETSEEEEW